MVNSNSTYRQPTTTMIDTDKVSSVLRAKAIRPLTRELLVTNLQGTSQERDLSSPTVCDGYGRIRHFKRHTPTGWPVNPLPIDPALRKLGLGSRDSIEALVFQNAACNWRCWYCFVPYKLLGADERYSAWLTPEKLVDLYLESKMQNPPMMIDLSGGQPELTPEWVPWMMEALASRQLESKVFLWSDDNLSNDYFWRYLTVRQIETIKRYPMYAKVCCFKGFDEESFSFNTKAEPALFGRQFELFKRYMTLGIDLYAYATFTAPNSNGIKEKIGRFVDRLQAIHPLLPLRMVPLEILPYSVVEDRGFNQQSQAVDSQRAAILTWNEEIERRFSDELRSRSIVDIKLNS
jgi:uncharacterized Fe-S cluster-containing radical SAM superfamily protein